MTESCKESVPSDVLKLKSKITEDIEERSDNLLCFAKAWPLVYQQKNGSIKNIGHV